MRPVNTVLQAILSVSAADGYLFPRPSGPFGTNIGTIGLVDTSRRDPFAPQPENRSTVISAIYPTFPVKDCNWTSLPAYPKRSAAIFDAEVAFVGVPNGTFENVSIQVCQSPTRANSCDGSNLLETPVVLFSGGLGLSRLWYSALAQSVASYGFIVVTVDHPYDADVVEFPDGRLIRAINSTWDDAQSEQDVNVRAADVSFVLDQLSKRNVVQQLFSGHLSSTAKGLNTSRAGIFGHSIGGATAATAMFKDSRFVAGVDLDGGLYGPVINQGLKSPFMLFAHQSNETSDTWGKIWPHLNWKLDIGILNSTHTSFTDIPILAELVFGTPLPPPVQNIVGRLAANRALEVISVYVAAFMDMVLRCKPQALLQRPDAAFPEIEFTASP